MWINHKFSCRYFITFYSSRRSCVVSCCYSYYNHFYPSLYIIESCLQFELLTRNTKTTFPTLSFSQLQCLSVCVIYWNTQALCAVPYSGRAMCNNRIRNNNNNNYYYYYYYSILLSWWHSHARKYTELGQATASYAYSVACLLCRCIIIIIIIIIIINIIITIIGTGKA